MTDAIAIYAQRYVHDSNRGGMIQQVQEMNGVLRKMLDDKVAVKDAYGLAVYGHK